MMAEELSERQQRAAERILEDEGLTEDLTDTAARALITWASEQASALAGDAKRSDEQVGEALKELRKAVRTAAASGEDDSATLIAQAQKALEQAIDTTASAPSPSANEQAVTPTPVSVQHATTEPAADSATDTKETSANPEPAPVTQPTINDQRPASKPKPARPPKPVRPPKPATKPKPKPQTASATIDQGSVEADKRLQAPDSPKSADQSAPESEEHLSDEERYARWLQNIENED